MSHAAGTIRFAYENGLLATVSSGSASVRLYRRADGRIVAAEDDLGRKVRYYYDGPGRLVEVKDLAGESWYLEYANDLLVAVTDPRQVTIFEAAYDGTQRAVRVRVLANAMDFYYKDRETHATDVLGRTTTFNWGADGITEAIVDPTGELAEVRFDAMRRPTELLRNGTPVAYMTYDARGRLATLKHLGSNARFSYGEHGLVGIDADDGRSQYGFDGGGRLTSASDEAGARNYRYASDGGLASISVKGSDGATVELRHGASGAASEVLRDGETLAVYKYRPVGRVDAIDYPGGLGATYQYDLRGLRSAAAYAGGESSSMGYDAAGNLIHYELRHANGEATSQHYKVGASNQVLSVSTDGAKVPTAWYEYDAAGKLRGVRAGGRTAVVDYGAADRVRRVSLDGGETEFEYSYEPGQADVARELDQRTGEARAAAGASAVFGPAHAIVYARLRAMDFGPLAYEPEHRTFRVSADHLRPDTAFLSSLRRRMVPLGGETPDPAPFGHDAPSNSLFLPPEYRAVNCQQCTSIVESVTVRIDEPVYVDERTNITVLANGVCIAADGADNYPYINPVHPFRFFVSFGDGTSTTYTPFLTSPEFRTSHVYRQVGPHTLRAVVRCSCPSALFSSYTKSVNFDVLCPVTPSTAEPSGVSAVSYSRSERSTSSWGRFVGHPLRVDIAAYYDEDSDSWKPKVTSATVREEIYVGYPSGIREASAAVATKSNCRQMINDLIRTSENEPIHQWAVLAAVRAHEWGHAREWEESVDRAFPDAKTTIEGLSVPHQCKMTAAQAKAKLLALSAYGKAVNNANDKARRHYNGIYANYAVADEQVVIEPIVRAIRNRAQDDWPSICQPVD